MIWIYANRDAHCRVNLSHSEEGKAFLSGKVKHQLKAAVHGQFDAVYAYYLADLFFSMVYEKRLAINYSQFPINTSFG